MIPLIILAIENDDDREFMISIYVELYPMMKSTAIKVVKDDKIAEDMAQDTIAHLIQKLDIIRGYERKRLVSYIRKAVYNNSLNYYNKYIKSGSFTFQSLEDDMAESVPDDSHSIEEEFEITEKYETLGKLMKMIPEREREILYLKYNMQCNDEAIGRIMGIKKESVRQYLTRARRIAKEYILKEGAIVE